MPEPPLLQPTPLQAVGDCVSCGKRVYLNGTAEDSAPIPHSDGWADGRPYQCPGSLRTAKNIERGDPGSLLSAVITAMSKDAATRSRAPNILQDLINKAVSSTELHRVGGEPAADEPDALDSLYDFKRQLAKAQRIVLCNPAELERVQAAVDKLPNRGLFEVKASAHVMPGEVYVVPAEEPPVGATVLDLD